MELNNQHLIKKIWAFKLKSGGPAALEDFHVSALMSVVPGDQSLHPTLREWWEVYHQWWMEFLQDNPKAVEFEAEKPLDQRIAEAIVKTVFDQGVWKKADSALSAIAQMVWLDEWQLAQEKKGLKTAIDWPSMRTWGPNIHALYNHLPVLEPNSKKRELKHQWLSLVERRDLMDWDYFKEESLESFGTNVRNQSTGPEKIILDMLFTFKNPTSKRALRAFFWEFVHQQALFDFKFLLHRAGYGIQYLNPGSSLENKASMEEIKEKHLRDLRKSFDQLFFLIGVEVESLKKNNPVGWGECNPQTTDEKMKYLEVRALLYGLKAMHDAIFKKAVEGGWASQIKTHLDPNSLSIDVRKKIDDLARDWLETFLIEETKGKRWLEKLRFIVHEDWMNRELLEDPALRDAKKVRL